VDDSLFPRFGKKVFGIRWQHDGTARGRGGLGLGNCFVVAGIVDTVPFRDRHLCLPVLFRLHVPKESASRTTQARELAGLLIAAFPGRRSTWSVTPCTAARPGATCRPGRPSPPAWPPTPCCTRANRRPRASGGTRWKGDRIGTAADLAKTGTWRKAKVRIYDQVEEVFVAETVCLWWAACTASRSRSC
jgi:hypothetical protein